MTPKNPKNGKKWQKGLKVQKIYPLVVPNQEFAPLEVKNEKTGTVGKSRSLSGQVLCESFSKHPDQQNLYENEYTLAVFVIKPSNSPKKQTPLTC